MSQVKMINVDALPNIPWQERPADLKTETPVWRYSGNPVMGRNPTPAIARIFNSAVVPWEDGFIAVLRGEQVNGVPYVYLGHSKDGMGRGTGKSADYQRERRTPDAQLRV